MRALITNGSNSSAMRSSSSPRPTSFSRSFPRSPKASSPRTARRSYQDAKSRFQEAAQEKRGVTPAYETLSEVGPDHDKRFTVGVYIGNEEIARGEGNSKQEAEQVAAQNALGKTGW